MTRPPRACACGSSRSPAEGTYTIQAYFAGKKVGPGLPVELKAGDVELKVPLKVAEEKKPEKKADDKDKEKDKGN